jgi:hypothetical protein
MNEEWERLKVPGAIEDLARDITVSLVPLNGNFNVDYPPRDLARCMEKKTCQTRTCHTLKNVVWKNEN